MFALLNNFPHTLHYDYRTLTTDQRSQNSGSATFVASQKEVLTAEPQFLEGGKRAGADGFVEESQTANTMIQCPSETKPYPEYQHSNC